MLKVLTTVMDEKYADPEVSAIAAICAALGELDDPLAAERVLEYAHQRFVLDELEQDEAELEMFTPNAHYVGSMPQSVCYSCD